MNENQNLGDGFAGYESVCRLETWCIEWKERNRGLTEGTRLEGGGRKGDEFDASLDSSQLQGHPLSKVVLLTR